METQPGVCRIGLSIGPTCSSMPRVSIASLERDVAPVETRLAHVDGDRLGAGAVDVSRPPGVSSRALSRPLASMISQPTQRAALPHCSTSPPSAFQMRMKASALAEGSMAISWSQPIPPRGRRWRAPPPDAGREGSARASTTTKSLPSPFIFRNGRLMGSGI